LRVIAGSAKGKILKAPQGLKTRPITDMIKEALFNVMGAKVHKSMFLDLFAGSGSVGIEALSRGAKWVTFIDNSNNAIKTIRQNLDNCNFKSNHEIFRNDVFLALEILNKRQRQFDIIYVDPPFTNEPIFVKVMHVLDKSNILKENGILIIRTPRNLNFKINLIKLKEYRSKNYGESTLHYFEGEKGEDGNI